MDYYALLGVTRDASHEEIQRAVALLGSTDGVGREEAAAVNQAWLVLRDPQRRQEYDARLPPLGAAPAADAPRLAFDPTLLSWWDSSLGSIPERIGIGRDWLSTLVAAAGRGLPAERSSKREALRPVHGVAGGAPVRGWAPFRRDWLGEPPVGARHTAIALDALLRIPGTRIFHGLETPGSPVQDIDHAVLNGNRLVYIDSRLWGPGEYRWLASDQLGQLVGRRTTRRRISTNQMLDAAATMDVCDDVRGHVVIHPSTPGAVTFTPGQHVSPDGISATSVQECVEQVGAWFLGGPQVGYVDRLAIGRLAKMLR